MNYFFTELPLPPSKNERTTRKGYYCKRRKRYVNEPVLSDAVRAYRLVIANKLNRLKGMFVDKKKTVLDCVWFKGNPLQDCANFHDELCDAIAPALGLNDRWFLVRDRNFFIDKKTPRVYLRIHQISEDDA